MVGNSVRALCQRALPLLFVLAACGSQPPTTPPNPNPTPTPESTPQSAATTQASTPAAPPKDPKAACKAAPRLATMLLVASRQGLGSEIGIPKNPSVVVAEKSAGPNARSLILTNAKKEIALRYSLPDGKLLSFPKDTPLNLARTRTPCVLGLSDGWKITDEKGLVVLLDAGGCAPAWKEEELPGLTITAEDVGCEAKSEDAIERACALRIKTPDGEELLASGEGKDITLPSGKYHISAGTCAIALRDLKKPTKGGGSTPAPTNTSEPTSQKKPSRRPIGEFRVSYAVVRID